MKTLAVKLLNGQLGKGLARVVGQPESLRFRLARDTVGVRQYLGKPSTWLWLEWELDKIVSGVPRRLKGLVLLLELRGKKDFTFDAKVVLNMHTIKNQLFPPAVEKLKP
jgi:hypothetical protein